MAGKEIGKTMVWIAIIFGVIIGASIFLVYKFENSEVKEVSISNDALLNGASFSLEEGDSFNVDIEDKEYDFVLKSHEEDKVILKIGNLEYEFLGESSLEFDLDKDGVVDIVIFVIKIKEDFVNFSVESPVIEVCTESWDCSSWGICINEFKKRVCVDQNSCETELLKPILEEGCEEAIPEEEKESIEIMDCGSSENYFNNCFLEKLEVCEPAFVLGSYSQNLSEAFVFVTSKFFIEGSEGDVCFFSEFIHDIDFSFNEDYVSQILEEGYTQEEINEQEKYYTDELAYFIGTWTKCGLSSLVLDSIFNEWMQGILNTNSDCSFDDLGEYVCEFQGEFNEEVCFYGFEID